MCIDIPEKLRYSLLNLHSLSKDGSCVGDFSTVSGYRRNEGCSLPAHDRQAELFVSKVAEGQLSSAYKCIVTEPVDAPNHWSPWKGALEVPLMIE